MRYLKLLRDRLLMSIPGRLPTYALFINKYISFN